MNFETIINILKKIDWKPILCDVYKKYGRPYLQNFVDSTENKFDDAAFAAFDELFVCTICGECKEPVSE